MNPSVTGLFSDPGLHATQPDGTTLTLAEHLDRNGTQNLPAVRTRSAVTRSSPRPQARQHLAARVASQPPMLRQVSVRSVYAIGASVCGIGVAAAAFIHYWVQAPLP